MKLRRLAAAIFLVLPVLGSETSGIIRVTGLRTWSHPTSTRVVLQMSGPFEYRADSTDPTRIYFDVPNARAFIGPRRFTTQPVNDALVKKVRVAEPVAGKTRIVFDLTGPAAYTVSKLSAPDRMVIEIRAKGGTSPARLAKAGRKRFVAPPVAVNVPRQVVLASLPPFIEPQAMIPLVLPGGGKGVTPAPKPITRRAPAPASTPAQVAATTKVLTPPTRPVTYSGSPKASESAASSLTRALGLKVNRIVIDAGHGGHDEGTSGPNGVLEKDVVLDVAQRLAKLLQTRLMVEVVLTRSDDTFIPLTERTAIANQKRADLFLSIHANSSPAPAVSGIETFFLNLSSSPGALDVAARENAGSDKSVAELRDLVKTITLNDKITESQNFAQTVQSSLYAQALRGNPAAHNRGVKRAPFVVLIGAQMPSILAEIGFLTNPKDEQNLSTPAYRQKIAESLYKGVAQYSQSLSHFEVAKGVERPEKGERAIGAGLN